jgi:hypothetical protein
MFQNLPTATKHFRQFPSVPGSSMEHGCNKGGLSDGRLEPAHTLAESACPGRALVVASVLRSSHPYAKERTLTSARTNHPAGSEKVLT